jgi:hypothetical protein
MLLALTATASLVSQLMWMTARNPLMVLSAQA